MVRSQKGFSSKLSDTKRIRAFLESIAPSLGIQQSDYDMWYSVSAEDISRLGGRKFLRGKKVSTLVIMAFPEHAWNRTRFLKSRQKSPSPALNSETREKITILGQKLGIKHDDFKAWYSVSKKTLENYLGRNVFEKFGTRYRLFSYTFPEHPWEPWFFHGSFSLLRKLDLDNRLRFGTYLEGKLGIRNPEDWYRITKADLSNCGHPRLFHSLTHMVQFLRERYPSILWDPNRMSWTSLGFSHLQTTLQQIFPEVLHPSSFFLPSDNIQHIAQKNRFLVAPKSKLMFEYQGPIRYAKEILEAREYLRIADSDSELIQGLLKREGLTFVPIPFWWDRKKESLLSTIFRKREDLFDEDGLLAGYRDAALAYEPIPDSISRNDLTLSDRAARSFLADPRFDHLTLKPIHQKKVLNHHVNLKLSVVVKSK